MSLVISVEEPDIVSIAVSQEPGALYPTFQLHKFPHHAKPEDLATWLVYEPPDLDINVNGTVWTCQCIASHVSGSRTQGIALDLTYIPKPFAVLQYSGYGLQLIFLSCPAWQKEAYTTNLDETVSKLFWKQSDPYCANGWTVKAIFAEIGTLAGVTIDAQLPAFHVQTPTLLCERGQTYLSFLTALLPTNGFTYAWHSQNDQLVVSLVEPAMTAYTVPSEAILLEQAKEEQPPYDLVDFAGGLYKPMYPVQLGTANRGTWGTSGRCNTPKIETLPDEVQTVGDYTQTTHRTRTIRQDEDGNPFAILAELEEVTGPIMNRNGAFAAMGTIRQVEIIHTYDNNDAAIYQAPRLKQTTRTVSGYVYDYVLGRDQVSYGILYYLTEDLEIITELQYQAMSPAPTILVSAKVVWQDNYEIHTEAKTYTTIPAVSQDWPEGSERAYTQEILRMMVLLDTIRVECTEDPQAALGRVIQAKSQEESPTVATRTAAMKQARLMEHRIDLKGPKVYEFTSRESRWNPQTGKVEHETQQTAVDSTAIPGQPTQYRVRPLKATAGEIGDGKRTVTPFSATIPTANPDDFAQWAGVLYWQITHPRRALSVQSATTFLPSGYRYANGTVTGFHLQQQGRDQSVRYAIE